MPLIYFNMSSHLKMQQYISLKTKKILDDLTKWVQKQTLFFFDDSKLYISVSFPYVFPIVFTMWPIKDYKASFAQLQVWAVACSAMSLQEWGRGKRQLQRWSLMPYIVFQKGGSLVGSLVFRRCPQQSFLFHQTFHSTVVGVDLSSVNIYCRLPHTTQVDHVESTQTLLCWKRAGKTRADALSCVFPGLSLLLILHLRLVQIDYPPL